MCSHYQTLKDAEKLLKRFGAHAPERPYAYDMRKGYPGLFVRRNAAARDREAVVGRWGLIAADASPFALTLDTFNARDDRVAKARNFRAAWRGGQFCVIPADAIFEPDWRQKYQIATRFTRADGEPLGLAGLWSRGKDESGEIAETYTMLTVNADDHPLFKHYHRRGEEKRMVVLLPDEAHDAWLDADPDQAMGMLRGAPAEAWTATPMPVGNATNLSLF